MTATVAPLTASDQTDADLISRHLYGDAEAFAELYERYAAMVYNLALRLSGSPEDAADLTQEIFLRVFRHLGKFKGRSSLKTWIYRVSINHCRSRLKRRYRSEQALSAEAEARIEDPRRSPEQRALAADASERVARGLERVKPVFREAVVLRDVEGLSYGEIAEILRVRIGTVRSRIARGREALREVLEDNDRENTR